MPATLDQLLGSVNTNGTPVNTKSFTTTADAAANTRIVVQVSCWNSGGATVATLTIGGVSATMDAGPFTNVDQRSWFFSIYTASLVPAGTTITLNLAPLSVIAIEMNASSWFGLQPFGTYVETSGSGTATDSTHWLTPSATVASPEALLIGFATSDGHSASTTSTPNTTSPVTTEIYDFWSSSTTQTTAVAYRVVSAGSYTIGGTWSTADAQHVAGIVAYKAAPILIQRFQPIPFQGRGRNL